MSRHTKRLSKSKLISQVSAIALLAAGLSVAAHAQSEAQPIEFDLPAQTLDSALRGFSATTEAQVLFATEIVDGKHAPAVIGTMAPMRALDALLADTGLTYELTSSNVILIRLDATTDADDAEEAGTASGTYRTAALAGAGAGVGRQPVEAESTDQDDAQAESERVQDTIVVTGTSIRGVYPSSVPLDVYTAEEIALSGATTLNRFLETLPQNVNSFPAGSFSLGPGEGDVTDNGRVDLRGLGTGTTLVLLNGRRLPVPGGGSVNTSLIPLAAIDRVEILTDGASAIYGSDAIGGVINYVLQDDFEGANVEASYGGATRGGRDQFQANATLGTAWAAGSAIISYAFRGQSTLDVSERDFSSNAPSPTPLFPGEETSSVVGLIDHDVTENFNVYLNGIYTDRSAELSRRNVFGVLNDVRFDEELISVGTGFEWRFFDDLFLNIEGSYVSEDVVDTSRLFELDGSITDGSSTRTGNIFELLAKVDGSLVDLPGGAARFSLGAGLSDEEYDRVFSTRTNAFERESHFFFAEGFAPIIGEDQGIWGVERLELSGAIRFTDYSDFGSAFTPRFGVALAPNKSLVLRGSYARGFRAPTLRDLSLGFGIASIFPLSPFGAPDPFSDDGSTILLTVAGPRLDGLEAEISDTITLGFDFEPEAIDGLRISASYFQIDYTDRVAPPSPNTLFALNNPDIMGFTFTINPSVADVQSAFEQIPVERRRDFSGLLGSGYSAEEAAGVATVIFDNRRTNLSSAVREGVDVSVDYSHDTSLGLLSYGMRASYLLEGTQQAVDTLPAISVLDTVGAPVSFRGNAFVGLTTSGFSGQITGRYVDSYSNRFVAPEVPIDSWTTLDVSLRYAFQQDQGLLEGVDVNLTVQNLFDSDPPFVGVADTPAAGGLDVPAGFDPVNANALGRFVTVGLRKRF